MNILEIEDVIKGLPDQALMQEAQAPSGQMPQFLVVSEIQRRADMRKRFQNQQQEMPQGTIAQQIVQGGIASMGNQQPIQPMPQQGMPPQGMPPMPPQGMPPAMQQQPPMSPPMSPPMMGQPPMQPQGMAAGGVVKMENGGDLPYTGGTQIDPGYEEFMRKQEQDYLLSQGRIRESMPAPEPSIMDRLLQGVKESGPNYSLVGSGLDFGETIDPVQRRMERESSLGDFRQMGSEAEMLREIQRQKNFEQSPFGEKLFTDTRPRSMRIGPDFTPATDFSGFDPITGDFLAPYLPQSTQADVSKLVPKQLDQDALEAGLAGKKPEDKAAADMMKESGDPDADTTKRSGDPDYEALRSTLDSFKPVDYSAFKPNYLDLITEQERRAQKIRDDASKDASAQALIQLGAGLAAGDVSKGLSSAGQAVADIKRQARAEARDEEGFARQLRLAEDEAAMRLGIQGAEAERELARFKATYGVDLVELEQTLMIARERIASEEATEAGRKKRARVEALNNLIEKLIANQYEGNVAENKKAISDALNQMKSELGITREKQEKSSTTDVIEAAKAIVGNR